MLCPASRQLDGTAQPPPPKASVCFLGFQDTKNRLRAHPTQARKPNRQTWWSHGTHQITRHDAVPSRRLHRLLGRKPTLSNMTADPTETHQLRRIQHSTCSAPLPKPTKLPHSPCPLHTLTWPLHPEHTKATLRLLIPSHSSTTETTRFSSLKKKHLKEQKLLYLTRQG